MTDLAAFAFGRDHATACIWGRGTVPLPWYAPETLPACFERELAFERLDLFSGQPEWGGEHLRWTFTGPQGVLRLEVHGRKVVLVQVYHDSHGCYRADPWHAGGPKHPEQVFASDGATVQVEAVRRLGVVRDRHHQVSVLVNGEVVLRQRCLLDLFRHQVGGTGGARAAGRLVGPAAAAVRLEIDAAQPRQAIIGWGGITAGTTYRQMSPAARMAWWRIVAGNNLLIQREYPTGQNLRRSLDNWDVHADAMPHYYGDNIPNGETSDFAYNAAIRRLGGEVWFEMWKLPAWVDPVDGGWHDKGGDIDHAAYAEATVAYCRASVARSGAPPEVVGIQNEICQRRDQIPPMIRALRGALDAAGFRAVRIHMANSSTIVSGPRFIDAHRHDAGAWAMIDYAAVNQYDATPHYDDLDRYRPALASFRAGTRDKDFLSPELSIIHPGMQHPGYAVALSAAQLIHDNLTVADARAVCWCWSLLDVEQPSYGWTRALCVPDWTEGGMPRASSRLLRVFASFSRHIRRGMRRLPVQTGDPDLLATAWIGPAGERTLVLINRSTAPQRVDAGGWADLPRWELTGPAHANQETDPRQDGAILLPPGAILTGTDLAPLALPAGFVPA
ncbi:MAG: hypothetical protein RLZZ127_449 [Planctomycetota bacterium]|jgi:hypothetical protein